MFTNRLKDELGLDAYAPYSGTEYDLAAGRFLAQPEPVRIEKKGAVSAATAKVTKTFARLLAAGQRLIGVIRQNEGGANKDLEKFTREIHDLCDKWER